jgi:hypothetical protein
MARMILDADDLVVGRFRRESDRENHTVTAWT